MNASEINRIFAKCGLPEVDRQRLLEIARVEGRNFEMKLRQAEEGDAAAIEYIGYMIRAVSPAFHETLKKNGFPTSNRRMMELAKREGKTLFRAILVLQQEGPMMKEASQYLSDLFTEDAYRPNPTQSEPPHASVNEQAVQHDQAGRNELPDFDTFGAADGVPNGAAVQEHDIPAVSVTGQSKQSVKPRQGSQQSKEEPTSKPPIKPPFYSFAVYASRAALCFAEDQTRTGDMPTVRIEAAPIANRNANWSQKIAIQLTPNELKMVLAVFLEKLGAITLEGHGPGRDKILVVENQDANFYVRVGQKGRGYAVPVRPQEAAGVVSLLYKQIIAGEPHLDMKMLDTILTTMANKILAAEQRQAQPS